jgi:hypothetical protein
MRPGLRLQQEAGYIYADCFFALTIFSLQSGGGPYINQSFPRTFSRIYTLQRKTLARFRPELARARARRSALMKVSEFRAALAGEGPALRRLAALDRLRHALSRRGGENSHD